MTEYTNSPNLAVTDDEDKYFSDHVEGFWTLVWKRFRRHKLAIVGAVILSVFLIFAVFAPALTPFPPDKLHLEIIKYGKPIPPDSKFIFGTDWLGRDYFTRTVYGGRTSLMVGILATVISLLIGVPLGALSGFYGGVIDMVISRFIEMLTCIPTFFLLLTVNALLKPNISNVILILGLFGWTGVARQVRAQFLSLRTQEYAEAAVGLGLSDARIIFKHLLPNSLMPVIVSATMEVAGNILAESGLSYLGMGIQEPFASWGSMLKLAQPYIITSPWLAIFPGLMISLIALSLNFIGDGLRDALDPRAMS
ncbi:MAG: ABC transporter permease [Anaerolineaceae bacterium]|nr:ABC transporter permease [Anaerolineaceae bacterium]